MPAWPGCDAALVGGWAVRGMAGSVVDHGWVPQIPGLQKKCGLMKGEGFCFFTVLYDLFLGSN